MPLSPTTALYTVLMLVLAVRLAFTEEADPSQVTDVSLFKAVRHGKPSLRVTWTVRQSDVNISKYQVQYKRYGDTFWGSQVDTAPLATSTLLPQLDAGTVYQVRVRAKAGDRSGMWSAEKNARTFDTPSMVSGVHLNKTMVNGEPALQVSWTTPQSDLTISQYQVQYRRSGTPAGWSSESSLSVSSPGNYALLTKLLANTEYTVRVRAMSEIGGGKWSEDYTERTADSKRLCDSNCTDRVQNNGKRLCDSNCTDHVQNNGNTTQVSSEAVGPDIAMVATVPGVILLVLIIIGTVVLVAFCLKRKQDRKKGQAVDGDDCEHVYKYEIVQTTSAFCDSPKKLEKVSQRRSPEPPRSASHHGYVNNSSSALQHIALVQSHYEMDDGDEYWRPAESLAGIKVQMRQNTKHLLEVQPESITIMKELGEGEFGTVHKGEWVGSTQGAVQVAVKSLRSQEKDSKYKLLKEAAIMGQFSHPNVVRLYGVIDKPGKVMLIMEYLAKGDLLSHLNKCRTCQTCKEELPLQLLRFCQEIAGAMDYLSKKGFIHRDLAARNILLSEQYMAKIADFGLSRDMDEDHYYKSKGGMIPVRWTAPEAILYKKYTTKSDVWSYGMVMYEIWSLGHKPFEELSIDQVVRAFESRCCQPPPPPPGCSRSIYKLMVDCWNPDHHSRPTFEDLARELSTDSEALLSWSQQDKAMSSKASVLGAPLEEGKHLYQELQNKYK